MLLPTNSIHPDTGVNTIDLVVLGTYLTAVLALVILSRGRLGRRVDRDDSSRSGVPLSRC